MEEWYIIAKFAGKYPTKTLVSIGENPKYLRGIFKKGKWRYKECGIEKATRTPFNREFIKLYNESPETVKSIILILDEIKEGRISPIVVYYEARLRGRIGYFLGHANKGYNFSIKNVTSKNISFKSGPNSTYLIIK